MKVIYVIVTVTTLGLTLLCAMGLMAMVNTHNHYQRRKELYRRGGE